MVFCVVGPVSKYNNKIITFQTSRPTHFFHFLGLLMKTTHLFSFQIYYAMSKVFKKYPSGIKKLKRNITNIYFSKIVHSLSCRFKKEFPRFYFDMWFEETCGFKLVIWIFEAWNVWLSFDIDDTVYL